MVTWRLRLSLSRHMERAGPMACGGRLAGLREEPDGGASAR